MLNVLLVQKTVPLKFTVGLFPVIVIGPLTLTNPPKSLNPLLKVRLPAPVMLELTLDVNVPNTVTPRFKVVLSPTRISPLFAPLLKATPPLWMSTVP